MEKEQKESKIKMKEGQKKGCLYKGKSTGGAHCKSEKLSKLNGSVKRRKCDVPVLEKKKEAGEGNVQKREEPLEDISYEHLVLSLQSPLPNEQQFALSVCMRLSSFGAGGEETKEPRFGLDVLRKTPALLNMLLAHAGFFQDGDGDVGLRLLLEEVHHEASEQPMDFTTFWEQVCWKEKDECEVVELELKDGVKNNDDDDDSQLSSYPKTLSRTLYSGDKVGQRVLLIGEIIRNFSFNLENCFVMVENQTLLRFVNTILQCEYGNLQQIGFDIASNIGRFMILLEDNPKSKVYKDLTQFMVAIFSSSNDRFKILRSLEFVEGIAKLECNWGILSDLLDSPFFHRLEQLMTISGDGMLVMQVLECVLALSEMEEDVLKKLENVMGVVNILVMFLTVASKDYFTCDGEFPVKIIGSKDLHGFYARILGEEPSNNGLKDVSTLMNNVLNVVIKESSQSQNGGNGLIVSPGKLVWGDKQQWENLTGIANQMAYFQNLNAGKQEIIQNSYIPQVMQLAGIHDTSVQNKACLPSGTNGLRKELSTPSGLGLGRSGVPLYVHLLHQQTVIVSNQNQDNGYQEKLRNPTPSELDNIIPYLCEWDSCELRFLDKKRLRWHVYEYHCPKTGTGVVCKCKWGKGMHEACHFQRSGFSLIQHMEDFHCSDADLEISLYLRRNGIDTPAQRKTPSTHSLRRIYDHDISNVAHSKTSSSEPEDAITKSIRLTAALALRNLAERSELARRSLKRFESHLADIAMNGNDCGGVVAQVLYQLSPCVVGENNKQKRKYE